MIIYTSINQKAISLFKQIFYDGFIQLDTEANLWPLAMAVSAHKWPLPISQDGVDNKGPSTLVFSVTYSLAHGQEAQVNLCVTSVCKYVISTD